jgi:type VI secretion system protein
MKLRTAPRLVLAAALGLAATGCGTLDAVREAAASIIQPGGPRTSIAALRVVAEPEANLNSATALDIVFVYEPKALDQLPKSGPDWFARKAELANLFPSGIDVVALQVPPATLIEAVKLPQRYEQAVRVLAYSNYFAKDGQSPANLTRFKRPVITLKPETIEYADG